MFLQDVKPQSGTVVVRGVKLYAHKFNIACDSTNEDMKTVLAIKPLPLSATTFR
jgi:hypothetical protein